MTAKQKQNGKEQQTDAVAAAPGSAEAVEKFLAESKKVSEAMAAGLSKADQEVAAIIEGIEQRFNAKQSLTKIFKSASDLNAITVSQSSFNKAATAALQKRVEADSEAMEKLRIKVLKNQAAALGLKSGSSEEIVAQNIGLKKERDALEAELLKVAGETEELQNHVAKLDERNRQLESELATLGEIRDKGPTKTIGRLKHDILLLTEALGKQGVPTPEGVGVQPPNASVGLSGGEQDSVPRTPMGAVPQTEAKN